MILDELLNLLYEIQAAPWHGEIYTPYLNAADIDRLTLELRGFIAATKTVFIEVKGDRKVGE